MASVMVPRHGCSSDHHYTGDCARSRTHDLARGNRGDRQARAADRADAARPSRDDDHRPRADRAARRRRGGGGGAGAADPVLRLRARHGADVRGRSLGVAGVWGAPTAHGAPGVARGTLGCGHPRHSDQRGAALGRRHSARRRPGAGDGGARRALSHGSHLVADPGLVVHRDPQFHGRGQPSGARAVGDAGGDPHQRRARLCADP